jgi:hypothetical protein
MEHVVTGGVEEPVVQVRREDLSTFLGWLDYAGPDWESMSPREREALGALTLAARPGVGQLREPPVQTGEAEDRTGSS